MVNFYSPYWSWNWHGGARAAVYFWGEFLILAEGMAYTVEPGIYLPDRGGVRIEDNMVITANGSETLSSLPRQLLTIG